MAELNKKQQKEVQKQVDKKVDEAQVRIEKFERSVEKRLSKKLIEKASHTASIFGLEFRYQTATAIIAAFGLLIALAWKDLVIKLVDSITHDHLLIKYPYLADIISAIIVTAVSVTGIVIVSRWAKK